jgi:hypothetical protein
MGLRRWAGEGTHDGGVLRVQRVGDPGGGYVLREFNNNHGFPSSCSSPLGSGRCWLVRAVSVMMRGAWKVVGSPRPSFLLERAAGSLRQNCLSFLGGGSCERRSRVM